MNLESLIQVFCVKRIFENRMCFTVQLSRLFSSSTLAVDLFTLSYVLSFVNNYFYFSEIILTFHIFKNNYFRQL